MANTANVSRQNQLDIKEIKTDVKHIREHMVPAKEFYRLQGAVIVVGTILMSGFGYLFSLI
jgi:hypothetical protein|tara:strand:- start:1135 stop:1317 length:183 start_codon:yes stop_codon:yes gene_type:complete